MFRNHYSMINPGRTSLPHQHFPSFPILPKSSVILTKRQPGRSFYGGASDPDESGGGGVAEVDRYFLCIGYPVQGPRRARS